jgi:hypothetical protein
MTTEEIQTYIDTAIRAKFTDYSTESGEMTTGPEGDGRFLGDVVATRYTGLPIGRDIFLAIGQTENKSQIVKFGKTECLAPAKGDLDMMLQKELGIAKDE